MWRSGGRALRTGRPRGSHYRAGRERKCQMGIESGCVSARYRVKVLLNLSRGRRGGICRDRIWLGDGLGYGAVLDDQLMSVRAKYMILTWRAKCVVVILRCRRFKNGLSGCWREFNVYFRWSHLGSVTQVTRSMSGSEWRKCFGLTCINFRSWTSVEVVMQIML